MTTEVQYDFTAPITAKGKQRSGDGWTLTFDWKMPGSKFDLVLYGQDWEQVSAWDINTVPDVSIQRGNLKNGKSGQYNTDYFWNLAGINQGNGQRTAPPATDRPQQAPTNGAQPRGDLDTRIAWNSAVNNAVHLYRSQDADTVEPWETIKHWAVEIYTIITAGPPGEEPPQWRDPRGDRDATEASVQDDFADEALTDLEQARNVMKRDVQANRLVRSATGPARPQSAPAMNRVIQSLNEFNSREDIRPDQRVTDSLLQRHILENFHMTEYPENWQMLRWQQQIEHLDEGQVLTLCADIVKGEVK